MCYHAADPEMVDYAEQVELERQRPRRNRIGPLRLLSGPARRLPDFIIVGAQKCGTTALYAYLEQHPDVASALTKEIHFFDNNYHRGLSWYRAHFPPRMFRRRTTGEASPSYLVHPLAPSRIRATVPDVRLIVLLRNPADRAYSHFHHNARKGRERRTFDEAVTREAERLRDNVDHVLGDVDYFVTHYQFSYLLRGIYASQLERWMKHFPPERLLILENRDLLEDPQPTFHRTLEFLGLRRWDPEYRIHHHYGYDAITPETRERLLGFFEPFNRQLYEMLGRDFGWEE